MRKLPRQLVKNAIIGIIGIFITIFSYNYFSLTNLAQDNVTTKLVVTNERENYQFIIYPEKRVPSTNNWGTTMQVWINTTTGQNIVYRGTITSNSQGLFTLELSDNESIPDGNYQIIIQSASHLRKKIPAIYLSQENLVYNLTGYGQLFAGDTHYPQDNFINSLDLSTLARKLNTSDNINDLNQDSLVNSLDLSIQVYNLGRKGDEI
ncbi:hypothetical protein JW887_00805 [Candidatus Dojkabacteria bacterium]|nr:hypothetical protein [Candidatus Dojkabacteria bacterium]